MNGSSNTKPKSAERTKAGYLLRWGITRNDKKNEENIVVENWDFNYNTNYYPKVLTKKEIMVTIIREKYDQNDEIQIAIGRSDDVDKITEHEDYVYNARILAESMLEEL